jgi:Tol biopolymer transport system component
LDGLVLSFGRVFDEEAGAMRRRRAARGLGPRGLWIGLAVTSLVLVVGVVGAVAAGSAPAKGGSTVGQIAFAVQHGDNDAPWDIYVVRTDGRWILRKKTTGLEENDPVWSPDGRHIGYHGFDVCCASASWVYTMNPDGTHRRRLARSSEGPQWSPDGRRIAYNMALFGRNNGIWVMNADGTGKRRLVRGPRCGTCGPVIGDPVWSPDGKQIAFTGIDGVYVVKASGGPARRVPGTANGQVEEWSPGRKITFWPDSQGSRTPIDVVNADGTGRQKVAMNAPDVGGWSPDGQLLIVLGGISIVRPSDGHVRHLTRSGVEPTWGDGGRKIAYIRGYYGGGPKNGLWIVNRDGSRDHRIIPQGPDFFSSPDWAPR